MRIVAGKFRRRRLLTNPGLQTRPLTDRVKETLFEHLEDELKNKRVADVFSGTGTIGFEALSRGAASVVFIETDRRALELLKRNVETLKVEDQTLCWRADVLRTSYRPKGVPHLVPFDVVFFDPPYKMVADLKPETPFFKSVERLAREGVTSPGAWLVFRTPADATFQLPDSWRPVHTFEFATMHIHLFRKADAPA
ncbi:MAG: 16S rRNA (guanine(966)-N(2))-methyltransferase RsmD [Planctomycetaceae bacterium]